MKKHIIISGVPRAGKSTVSHLLSKTYGYQHVSMDAVIAGFERCFPELGINTYADKPAAENLRNISAKLAPFLNAMLQSGEYDGFERGMVIDVFQLLPEDFVRHIDRSLCDIYYFITADVTPEERFRQLKAFDTPLDYTYHKSDDENREGCIGLVEQSKRMREQCLQYGLPFYETSGDRDEVLRQFLKTVQLS